MDAQSQSNVEEKVKSLMAEDDESSDDVQNDQSEKQNTWVHLFWTLVQLGKQCPCLINILVFMIEIGILNLCKELMPVVSWHRLTFQIWTWCKKQPNNGYIVSVHLDLRLKYSNTMNAFINSSCLIWFITVVQPRSIREE